MNDQIISPKKLIEVSLPLNAINEACAYEKMPGIGPHPRGLHLWWARRPLAAARAVIFSQLVNDPSGRWEIENPGKVAPNHLKASWAAKRKHLFRIIEELVKWENTTNKEVLEKAKLEIEKSWQEVCELNKSHPQAQTLFNPKKPPALHDPFAGGGAIPLEAQRLGLNAFASDLNPIAVLINKAMIEFPPLFSGSAPIGKPVPEEQAQLTKKAEWVGPEGLAEDVRRYGYLMFCDARKSLSAYYPDIEITRERIENRVDLEPYLGKKLTVIAWVWARTVQSPNPAFGHVDVPLVSSFILSNKTGSEAYIEPVIEGDSYHFQVKIGKPDSTSGKGTTAGKWNGFRCLLSNVPIPYTYIRDEGLAGRLSTRLMAVVVEGKKGKLYLSPNKDDISIAQSAVPSWKPELLINYHPRDIKTQIYGLTKYAELFTARQLLSLSTLSDLVSKTVNKAHYDAIENGLPNDGITLENGGKGALAYAQAIGVYLSFCVDRCADFNNSITRWVPGNQKVMNLFSKQAIPMSWDFAEANIMADTVGGFLPSTEFLSKCILKLPAAPLGTSSQADAQTQSISTNKVISTDPPYYDNIGYADLSDFFYVWLRQSLKDHFPLLLSTIAVPKGEELVATPYRHGSKEKAEQFFMDGMTSAMSGLAKKAHPEMPITIYYAFKQSETEDSSGTTSTGWETFLEAVIRSGLTIKGTWPLRSEQEYRMMSIGNNALASSILLVCRCRPEGATTVSRREFIRELNIVLPDALEEMIHGTDDGKSPVAPVDLSQAVIGPGMGVFSKYSAVLEADGSKMSVRTALQLINKYFLENDFDPETQWCLKWFEQNGWKEGVFGQADDLSRALGTSVDGVAETGVIESGGGKVRLLRPTEYPSDWDPKKDKHIPIWETLHHLIRSLRTDGETQTGRLLGAVKSQIEGVRLLAFRLYTLCERAGWADDARTYNELMTSWTAVETAAGQVKMADRQGELF